MFLVIQDFSRFLQVFFRFGFDLVFGHSGFFPVFSNLGLIVFLAIQDFCIFFFRILSPLNIPRVSKDSRSQCWSKAEDLLETFQE